MIIQDAVEGAVDAITDIVHEGLRGLLLHHPLADDVHCQCVGGTGKVPTWERGGEGGGGGRGGESIKKPFFFTL